MNDSILPFVDIETTGLSPAEDIILEVGVYLTDPDLNVISSLSHVIHHHPQVLRYAEEYSVPYVRNMHTENGLFLASRDSSLNKKKSSAILSEWLSDHGATGLPMVGSSLALDRAFLALHMPEFHELFHYRSIDNSSTKELCRRYAPDVYAKLPDSETDHRVATCLKGTIEEFKFYKENFLKVTA